MDKYQLQQGDSDLRIYFQIDYEGGSQIELSELATCQKREIYYSWKDVDGTEISHGIWDATGYYQTGDSIYLYYQFSGNDVVPTYADKLRGYVKLTDSAGRVSIGKTFYINVLATTL